jgi:hypothetical protein
MGLDIFFIEDVRNALLAADEASSSTARACAAVSGDQVTLRAYLEGYRAALTTVALAFGLSPAIIAGRGPSTSSGQAPSTSSGQAPSTSSGRGEILEVQARTVEGVLLAGGGAERRAKPRR